MCGIAGILAAQGSPFAAADGMQRGLERLAAALAHRGPDASGFAISGGIGLAHRRLSIIDLSPTGAQPMWTPDRRFVIAFNGEVYNFPTLRRTLEEAGERFAGRSDTEVILRLLAREGASALAKLDGMFAIALVDVQRGTCLLARDRTGQKPLYVAELPGGGHAFASELAPLLALPGVDRSIDREALSHLLTFGLLPAPFTLRRGVRQLLPGTAIELSPGAAGRSFRFAPEPGPGIPQLEGSIESLEDALLEVLSRTVKEHLVADVPVGVLLSGGVDSSTVAALAARHAGRLETFCVVQRDPRHDERRAARTVADHIGSLHHEIELPAEGLTEQDLDDLVDHHGDPFADYSSLNVLRLSREMRKHVTVALSGDGGDELFAGYDRFAQLRWLSSLGRLPASLLAGGALLLARGGSERIRRAARALRVASLPPARRAVAFTTWFWPEEQRALLRPEWTAPGPVLDALLEARGASLEADPVASAHWLEQRMLLPDDMLTKVDRMSMAASLEVRPPLLGNAVVAFAARLPFDAKLEGGATKRVLRGLARRLVPAQVIDRPKQGFTLNLREHGGAVLRDATRFALGSDASPLRDYFRAEALASLAREFEGGGRPGDAEDSDYRRTGRQWLLTVLARSLVRMPAA